MCNSQVKYCSWLHISHVSHLPNMFPKDSRHFPNIFANTFPTSSRHLLNIFPTCSQHVPIILPNILPNMLPNIFQHLSSIFPTSHLLNMFTTSSQHLLNMFPTPSQTFSQHLFHLPNYPSPSSAPNFPFPPVTQRWARNAAPPPAAVPCASLPRPRARPTDLPGRPQRGASAWGRTQQMCMEDYI